MRSAIVLSGAQKLHKKQVQTDGDNRTIEDCNSPFPAEDAKGQDSRANPPRDANKRTRYTLQQCQFAANRTIGNTNANQHSANTSAVEIAKSVDLISNDQDKSGDPPGDIMLIGASPR